MGAAVTATTTLSLILFLSLLSAPIIAETKAQAEPVVHLDCRGEDAVQLLGCVDGKIGLWPAFEPSRDAGHNKVLWLVKEDGFYLSWDGSGWVKKAIWNTE
ncbi:hypothetical protein NL676_021774 [Syzygium grande]|nr:hypothetical protein NL676_021774 [Syzygium grande]